jgi:glycosyltransferase involved in cell wall biosynthesis
VAVITPDVLGERMAGPAIRAFQIAVELSARGHQVTLVSTSRCEVRDDRFVCTRSSWSGLRRIVAGVDVVVVQGYVTYHAPWLLRSDVPVVVDLYDPLHLEQLEQLADRPPAERQPLIDLTVRVLNEQVALGDFFLCASEEQRHLWLGHLGAFGRINTDTYGADPTMRALIDVVPFGLPDQAPRRSRSAIKGVVPGIGPNDKVVLWAGGVYNWFDPLTLIRAVARLSAQRPDLRLYFLGMRHPNPEVPEMRMATAARALADELGLTDRHVFFNEGWVAYDDRQNYLLDADVGVSTHFDHLETAFSFRTRILDYLWAGLPVVATGGDGFGQLIESEGLGRAVAEQDEQDLAAALDAVLYDPEVAAQARENVGRVREQFMWSRALKPLMRFCADPRPAADAHRLRIVRHPVMPRRVIARWGLRVAMLLRRGGPKLVLVRLRERLAARGAE